MAFLKKPFIAAFISLVIVLLATFVSVNIKLGNECENVTDGFYTGELCNGTQEQSISSQLEAIVRLSESLEQMAGRYDVDFEDLSDAREYMQYAFLYSHSDISYIYYTYGDLIAEMKNVYAELSGSDMSAQDAETVEGIMAGVSTAQDIIRSSDYNESVREYLLSYDKFPTNVMGEFADVNRPEYFS